MVLAEFLAEVGNLSQVIMYVPIRLEYSHLIAAVIVLVELFSGFGQAWIHWFFNRITRAAEEKKGQC